MARFHVLPKSSLSVQFWLLGLDTRNGLLARQGFSKSPAPIGSSFYTLNSLRLHSSGFRLELPAGTLEFDRRTVLFRLNGQPLPRQQGFELSLPVFERYEAWIAQECGADYRAKQLAAYKLPPPVRRNLALWQMTLGQGAQIGPQQTAPLPKQKAGAGAWPTPARLRRVA